MPLRWLPPLVLASLLGSAESFSLHSITPSTRTTHARPHSALPSAAGSGRGHLHGGAPLWAVPALRRAPEPRAPGDGGREKTRERGLVEGLVQSAFGGSPVFWGPVAEEGDMVAAFDVEGVDGLQLMVGPSLSGLGYGLFVRVRPGGGESGGVALRAGARLCRYGVVGGLRGECKGDRAVQFALGSASDDAMSVFYKDVLMPLREALKASGATGVLGHRPIAGGGFEPAGEPLYFVPAARGEVLAEDLGSFANDLAYSDGCSEEQYAARRGASALGMRWHLEERGGALVPAAVELALRRNLVFRNERPMEIGNLYGWGYWRNTRYGEARGRVAAAVAASYALATAAFAAAHVPPGAVSAVASVSLGLPPS